MIHLVSGITISMLLLISADVTIMVLFVVEMGKDTFAKDSTISKMLPPLSTCFYYEKKNLLPKKPFLESFCVQASKQNVSRGVFIIRVAENMTSACLVSPCAVQNEFVTV